MTPVCFSCEDRLDLPPERIAEGMLDLAKWPGFRGYGPLPGIEAAEFEVRTPEVVGTRIRVLNTDGSRHVEEFLEWDPGRRIRLQLCEFSPPLSRLATRFDELWTFERIDSKTRVVRSFELHPRSRAARPALRLIALLFKRAINRHFRQIDAEESRGAVLGEVPSP